MSFYNNLYVGINNAPPPRSIIKHSAKGTEWKKHKYIKKVDGKYYYPDDYRGGRHLPQDKNGKEKVSSFKNNPNLRASFNDQINQLNREAAIKDIMEATGWYRKDAEKRYDELLEMDEERRQKEIEAAGQIRNYTFEDGTKEKYITIGVGKIVPYNEVLAYIKDHSSELDPEIIKKLQTAYIQSRKQ